MPRGERVLLVAPSPFCAQPARHQGWRASEIPSLEAEILAAKSLPKPELIFPPLLRNSGLQEARGHPRGSARIAGSSAAARGWRQH